METKVVINLCNKNQFDAKFNAQSADFKAYVGILDSLRVNLKEIASKTLQILINAFDKT